VRAAGIKPRSDRFPHPAPFALLKSLTAVPSGMLFREGRFFWVGGILSHDAVGKPIDFYSGNEPWQDHVFH
jgi:hypothetical protein